MGRTYRVGEVAAMFGVSVRTLHHYDERGLLEPSQRSEAETGRAVGAVPAHPQLPHTRQAVGLALLGGTEGRPHQVARVGDRISR